jgi:hypothetical protein
MAGLGLEMGAYDDAAEPTITRLALSDGMRRRYLFHAGYIRYLPGLDEHH